MGAPRLQLVDEPFRHRGEGNSIDIIERHTGAQDRIVYWPCRFLNHRAQRRFASTSGQPAAQFALMQQYVFGNVPAAVYLSQHLVLWNQTGRRWWREGGGKYG